MSDHPDQITKPGLIRITTVPVSLKKLLEGQLNFMSEYYEVTAVSSNRSELEAYGQQEGVKTFYLPLTRKITPIRDLLCVFKLYKYLKRVKPLIVHTHTPKAGVVGMMAAKLAGVSVRLHTVAGLPLVEATGLKRWILDRVEKYTYKCATKVLPNSKGLKEIIVREGYCTTDKLEVLGEGSSNGIDTNYFSRLHFNGDEIRSKREKLNIPFRDKVFVFIGRIVKDKGINELIGAFVKLNTQLPDSTLLLVGPYEDELDPLSPETKNLIESHTKIITTGYQEDVRIYLALSDILVFPSYREGFPNVVMQAGAMGLPVVASDINGCNEIIQDGINGMLIPVKNEKELLIKMKELTLDRELREQLAANARERIVTKYDRLKMWKTILNEYREQQANL